MVVGRDGMWMLVIKPPANKYTRGRYRKPAQKACKILIGGMLQYHYSVTASATQGEG